MKVVKLYNYIKAVSKTCFFNLKNYGLRYAHWVYWSDVALKLKLRKLAMKMLSKKRKYILHYIDIVAQQNVVEKIPKKEVGINPKIWMFWWTGMDSAPDIVKISANSVKTNANGFEVCILDKDNYQNYVCLPQYIIEKHENGIITHAMFSDILRMTLLSLYGGVWIDATIICLKPLPEVLKTQRFYTCKTYDKNSIQASKSRWTSFFIAGRSDFSLFSSARDLLYAYWRIYNAQIDYLLIDYIIEYIRIKDEEVRMEMKNLSNNNYKRNDLFNRLNEPYSEDLIREYLDDATFVYKCSWRYGLFTETDESGKLTMYGFLKSKYLS